MEVRHGEIWLEDIRILYPRQIPRLDPFLKLREMFGVRQSVCLSLRAWYRLMIYVRL